MREVECFLPMRRPPTVTAPNGKRADRSGGRTVVHDSDALADARALVTALMASHTPDAPLEGPLGVELIWSYPLRGGHVQGEPYALKPDVDNTAKLVLDVMEGLGWFEDDKRICDERVVQVWGDPGGLYVRLWEIEWKSDGKRSCS